MRPMRQIVQSVDIVCCYSIIPMKLSFIYCIVGGHQVDATTAGETSEPSDARVFLDKSNLSSCKTYAQTAYSWTNDCKDG